LDDVDIRDAAGDEALAQLLEDGRIDALFTANVPQNVLDGSARNIVRLFPDYVPVERDYYRRTGILPMMHTIVMPRRLAKDRPDLVRATYDAFVGPRHVAMGQYATDRTIFEVSTLRQPAGPVRHHPAGARHVRGSRSQVAVAWPTRSTTPPSSWSPTMIGTANSPGAGSRPLSGLPGAESPSRSGI
jgi:hypothetical protein